MNENIFDQSIIEDPSIPVDEIHFKIRGKTVGKIVNLDTPTLVLDPREMIIPRREDLYTLNFYLNRDFLHSEDHQE